MVSMLRDTTGRGRRSGCDQRRRTARRIAARPVASPASDADRCRTRTRARTAEAAGARGAAVVPATVGAHAAVHARRAAHGHRLRRRPADRVPAQHERHRPGQSALGRRCRAPATSGSSPTRSSCSPAGWHDESDLPLEERRRRERAREAAGGITSYAVDTDFTLAAFALAGAAVRRRPRRRRRPASWRSPPRCSTRDPTRSPSASRTSTATRSASPSSTGRGASSPAGDDEPGTVTWGSAEFAAAEEIDRQPGLLVVARRDVDRRRPGRHGRRPRRRTSATPPTPSCPRPSTATRSPARRTRSVAAHRRARRPDRQSRRRRRVGPRPLRIPHRGAVEPARPAGRGAVARPAQHRGARRRPGHGCDVGPVRRHRRRLGRARRWDADVHGRRRARHVRRPRRRTAAPRRRRAGDARPTSRCAAVAAADGGGIVFVANPIDDATVAHVWRYTPGADGGAGELEALTDEPGIHSVAAGGGTVVVRTATLDEPRTFWDTLDGVELRSHAKAPNIGLNASVSFLGTAAPGSRSSCSRKATTGPPLPVLVDPYGGPHALRAVRSHLGHLTSQWFANQGFAVVVSDNRGTPGRGSDWERAVHFDLATAGARGPGRRASSRRRPSTAVSTSIVSRSAAGASAAIWPRSPCCSGPTAFHAAIAGAPVTEWRLYDTHYTERYLGDPDERADAYDGSSLLPLAGDLTRPLLLIHGLADDNVMAAHTLRLSSALLAAGRPHEVLPLVGVTHMTPQEVVAENLLLHQLDFLRRSLGQLRRQTAPTATVPSDGEEPERAVRGGRRPRHRRPRAHGGARAAGPRDARRLASRRRRDRRAARAHRGLARRGVLVRAVPRPGDGQGPRGVARAHRSTSCSTTSTAGSRRASSAARCSRRPARSPASTTRSRRKKAASSPTSPSASADRLRQRERSQRPASGPRRGERLGAGDVGGEAVAAEVGEHVGRGWWRPRRDRRRHRGRSSTAARSRSANNAIAWLSVARLRRRPSSSQRSAAPSSPRIASISPNGVAIAP